VIFVIKLRLKLTKE